MQKSRKVSAQLEATKPARRWSATISRADSDSERSGLQTHHRDDGKRFVVRADEKLTGVYVT